MVQLPLRKYRAFQATHMTVALRDGTTTPDSAREICWVSRGDCLAAAATEERQEVSLTLKTDELDFYDITRPTFIFGHKHVVSGDPVPPI